MNTETLKIKRDELSELRQLTLKGHVVRSRAEWLMESEKPSKYYVALERFNYINKTVKMINNNGKQITSQKEILNCIKDFYANLFDNRDNLLNFDLLLDKFSEINIPTLSDSHRTIIDNQIQLSDISEALKKMCNNKTPGSDGLPAEFFKVFWSKLNVTVYRAILDFFNKGKMSLTPRLGIISCLPKSNKPREYLKNWRPLTMLSVIYKLISSALSNKIKPYLPLLIGPTQSGFVEGRFIGDTTRLIYDIIHITDSQNITGLLMLIDFEKAFDSISWKFLYKVLETFNFGHNLIRWVKILNTDIQASILQCGFFSERFQIKRGCRQGDPIAPSLFILCAEILSLLIKHNKDIKGLKLGNLEIKITQFADDTTLILDGSLKSLQAALNTIEIFGSISGLNMNSEKTKVIWLGRQNRQNDKLDVAYKLEWGTTEFKLLGINFSTDLAKIGTLNYDHIILTLEADIKKWNRRNITPLGRIALIKSLFLSKLTHLFLTIPTFDSGLITKIEKMLYAFLWNNKPDKIKRDHIVQNYNQGGLKMVNIKNFVTALKITWIRRLYTNPDNIWVKLVNYYYFHTDLIFVRGSDWINEIISGIKNNFWVEVLNAYQKLLLSYHPPGKAYLLMSPLWSNPNIKIDNELCKKFSNANINIIHDILDYDGAITPLDTLREIISPTITWLDYAKVKVSIREYLGKDNFTSIQKPSLPLNVYPLIKDKKGIRNIYTILNSKKIEITSITKWNIKLPVILSSKNWSHIFKIANKTIMDNKFVWFQWKVIHRILGVRNLLFKMNISNKRTCGLCGMYEETIEHLFTECETSIHIWNELYTYITQYCTIPPLDNISKIFGYMLNDSKAAAINTILLIMRYYIFQKCKYETSLCFAEFQRLLSRVFFEQELLAKLSGNIKVFNKKWSILRALIL